MTIAAYDGLSAGSQEAMQLMREELRRLLIIKAAAAHQTPAPWIPSWCINFSITLGVHVLVAGILFLVVVATRQLEAIYPPMRMSVLPPPEHPQTVNRTEQSVAPALDVQIQDTPAAATASPQIQIVDEIESPDTAASAGAVGRTEAISDSQMGLSSPFMAIGSSGGGSGVGAGSGALGNRGGSRKRHALLAGGGNVASEAAVNRALQWFKRHQIADGRWDGQSNPKNCADSPILEGAAAIPFGNDSDVGLTSLALLCFLGSGYDHHVPSRFRITVQKGITWLLGKQSGNGLVGPTNYEHALATMVLSEAYALSRDPDLEIPAQKAVNALLARQNENPHPADSVHVRLGWDYYEPSTRNDSSVTGWNVMALKSAYAAGLKVGLGLENARVWFDLAWHEANPKAHLTDPYHDTSTFPYVLEMPSASPSMTSVGALCAIILGHGNGDIIFESLCNGIIATPPQASILDSYNMYYATLSLFQAGGSRWKAWNPPARDLLVRTQCIGHGCYDGSWNPSHWGRFLDTAWYCLSLEVYYRYQRVDAH